jgi:endonuclease/exonuclease/phosphatase family metal-dependent hydrolase
VRRGRKGRGRKKSTQGNINITTITTCTQDIKRTLPSSPLPPSRPEYVYNYSPRQIPSKVPHLQLHPPSSPSVSETSLLLPTTTRTPIIITPSSQSARGREKKVRREREREENQETRRNDRETIGIMFQNVQGATPKYGKQKLQDTIAEAEREKLSMCFWTETWAKEGDLESMQSYLREMEMSSWGFIGKRRKVRSATERKGSGGIACIFKKEERVEISIAKYSEHEGTLWIERKQEGREPMYIAVVYLVPKRSTRQAMVPGAIDELVREVADFSARGQVVVGGDFNMWTDNSPNVMRVRDVEAAEERFGEVARIHERESMHKEESCERGKTILKNMNDVGMVMMNGVRGEATSFTCTNTNRGRRKKFSTIDYVFCKEEMFLEEKARMKFGQGVISDHKALIFYTQNRNTVEGVRTGVEEKKAGRWKINDRGKPEHWDGLKKECDLWMRELLGKWKSEDREEEGEEEKRSELIEERWEEFKKAASTSMEKGVGRSRPAGKRRRVMCFDEEVQGLKREVRRAERDIMKARVEDRGECWRRARELKRRIKNKVKFLINKQRLEKMMELEACRTADPKEFWKKIKNMGGFTRKTKALPETMIDQKGQERSDPREVRDVWKEAWESLGREIPEDAKFDVAFLKKTRIEVERRRIESDRRQQDTDHIDRPIERAEISKAIKRLRKGKSAGVDEIVTELLKFGGEIMEEILWFFFDQVWREERVPEEWSKAVIVPLFKKGDKRDPFNYRGISLLSIVGKTFAQVLNMRIMEWVEDGKKLSEEQGGFRAKRGCPDQIFVLNELIEKTCKKGGNLFTCFIDLKKAYDSVSRVGLWKVLWEKGVRGKMWRVLQQMYRRVQSCVRVGEQTTEWFEVDVGVRQGCVLSPVLFSLFIDGLAEEVIKVGEGVEVGDSIVQILLYADDMVVTAKNKKDLQKMMSAVQKFTHKWRLEVNAGKTEVVVFGVANSNTKDTKIKYGDAFLKVVTGYTYLGIFQARLMKSRGVVMKKEMVSKARMKMEIAWGLGSRFGRVRTSTGVHVWKGLIRPTLEYAAEVWHRGKWEEAEKIQRSMGKRILGCRQNTTNEAVLGELGWWTMEGRRDLLMVCYWAKICRMDESRLVKRVYEARKQVRGKARSSWCDKVKEILYRLGVGDKWDSEDVGSQESWAREIKKCVLEEETRKWQAGMEAKPKLREYRKYKRELKQEMYLEEDGNWRGRQLLTGLRTGSNGLRVETDRWHKVPLEWRLCPMCAVETETEHHFLSKCRALEDAREQWARTLPEQERHCWNLMNEEQKTEWLLTPTGETTKMVKSLMVKLDINRSAMLQ